ncbi:GNAT family N-acetyltransferase [Streptomyces sp. NPDC004647]|uniref:GNAT family N-acetyltransferase n=1 Tax=Streptomyces sp. NPDC004647 TaxID=3154671 RepID=UPI0033BF4C4A
MNDIRSAAPADGPAVRAATDAAYHHCIDRIGIRPAPMDADHTADIAAGRVFVTGDPEPRGSAGSAARVGALVLVPEADHLFLESVAVHPRAARPGCGPGPARLRRRYARERGLPEIRLYTNALMWENQELYPCYGYEVTERRQDGPYDRIHYRKRV